MRVAINVGTRFPAYATSMGRVLLAALPEPALRRLPRPRRDRAADRSRDRQRRGPAQELARVREQGWALVDQELEEGLRSIAAPIHDAERPDDRRRQRLRPRQPRQRATTSRQTLLPPLLETARRIEADLTRAYNHQ